MFSHFVATAKPARCTLACVFSLMLYPTVAMATDSVQPQPSVPGTEDDQRVTHLPGVVVHGRSTQAAHARDLTPGHVAVLEDEPGYHRAVANMADLLRNVPGIWAQSGSGGDSMFLSSRGSNLDATGYDNNGVKLFQDGLPVTAADGNNHNRFLDPLHAQEVVVAMGANALTYGASTLGGAIDFISPTARNGATTQLFLVGDSAGGSGVRARLAGIADMRDGLLALEGRHRDGFRAHARQDRFSLYANAGWRPSTSLDLRLFATHIDNRQELPGALTRAQFDADPWQANAKAVSGNYQLNVTTDRLALTGNLDIAAGRRLQFGASLENQSLYHPIVDKVLVDFDGAGPSPPTEVFSLLIDTKQRTVGGMLRYGFVAGQHAVLMGANLAESRVQGGHHRNDGGRRNGQTDVIDNHSRSVELFVVDHWRLAQDWLLTYGAQGVWTSRDVRALNLADGSVRNPRGVFRAINPRLGLIRELGGHRQAYASLSRLYEPPTTFELQDDVRGGDAVLDAMRGGVLEFGMRGSKPADAGSASWEWDVSAYYARIHGEILSVDNPAAPGTSLSANIDATTHAGIEVQWGGSMPTGHADWRLEPMVSATWNAFSFADDPVYGNNALPAAPRFFLRGELMFRRGTGFYIGPTVDLVGARYADFGNHYRVGGHALAGLRMGMAHARWDAYVEVRNLFNRRHVGKLDVRNFAAEDAAILQPGMPRMLQAGLRIRF